MTATRTACPPGSWGGTSPSERCVCIKPTDCCDTRLAAKQPKLAKRRRARSVEVRSRGAYGQAAPKPNGQARALILPATSVACDLRPSHCGCAGQVCAG
jgi:hypothetical protein